jgi:PAS domain S-box-containing protein
MENIETSASPNGLFETNRPKLTGINPELLPNLMHNLPGMAYRCKNDSKWTMIFISEGSVDLTGYSAGELLQNSLLSYDEVVLEEDREYVRQTKNSAVAKRVQFQLEYRIKHKNGEIHWVWEKGNAVYDKHHNPVYLDGFITDVTTRRKAEEDLKRAAQDLEELNATKDRFFSLLAHDLQNPVYAIISLSEFVAENFSNFGRAEVEDALLQIHNASRGIYTLLENLLDWARLQSGQITIQKEFVSLVKTTNYVLDHYRKAAIQKGIALELVYENDMLVESDLRLLSSILRNLVSNAIKYSYPKSTVIVHLHRTESGVELCVEDRGLGISRRHLQKLFKIDNDLRQYGTANEAGSGLGLILVDNYARLLGIKVSVESRLNHGSKFRLLIPPRI